MCVCVCVCVWCVCMCVVCVCVCVCVCVRACEHTSPSSVFSTRPFTMRANSWSSSFVNLAEMMGVLMVLAALIISLIRGTPSVMSTGVKGI